ncbi:MAG: Hsp70 family protein, partial [Akkermansiaceae bacterium]|nr:Hsp70 family protein [Akkermansiaceae bacterium]
AMERVQWISEGRRVKLALSDAEEATYRIPFTGEVPVSRKAFQGLMKPFLARMESCCRRAMLDAEVTGKDLAAVVMVGGSSRIPMVKDRVATIFEQEPDLSQHPDEAIARGAAIQAGILAGTIREVLLLDVTPLSLGIETMGGLMNVLIPRNTTIPCRAGEMFTNAAEGQESMKVKVLQGERELAKDNWELGSFEVRFEPDRRGQARVGVEFRIDADGILSVLARDVARNIDTVIKIGSAAVDVKEAKVEQMVSESVEFAFEDMNARVFEESRLKAEELLPAVEVALEQAGSLLTPKEIARIQEARERVEKAIEERKVAELKASVEQLDEVTESLAAMLVEEATKAIFSNPQD